MSYFDPIADGELGSPETVNSRLQQLADAMVALAASAIPAVVPWTTLGGAIASISILSLPQTFKTLRLMALLRTSQAATKSTLVLRLNGDTNAANYYMRRVHSAAAVTTTVQTGSGTNGFDMQDLCTAALAPADFYGFFIFDIVNYTVTTSKGVLFDGYCQGDLSTSAEFEHHSGGGNYNGAAGVSQIDLIPGSGNFVAGSKYAVFGLI